MDSKTKALSDQLWKEREPLLLGMIKASKPSWIAFTPHGRPNSKGFVYWDLKEFGAYVEGKTFSWKAWVFQANPNLPKHCAEFPEKGVYAQTTHKTLSDAMDWAMVTLKLL